jgi:hypothetical protein
MGRYGFRTSSPSQETVSRPDYIVSSAGPREVVATAREVPPAKIGPTDVVPRPCEHSPGRQRFAAKSDKWDANVAFR